MTVAEIDRAFWRGRRVLVTGHTGFKGTWLSAWLVQMGADVGGLSRGLPTTPSLFAATSLESQLYHVEGDVADAGLVGDLFQRFRPEIVIHLAGQAIVKHGFDDPRGTFDTNLMGTVTVLDAIRRTHTVRAAVMVTSDKCYQDQHRTCAEDDPLGGYEAYGASKACAEIAIQAYRAAYFPGSLGCGIASARAGNVYGAGDYAPNRLVPDLVRAFLAGERPLLRCPDAVRPWQHVLDAVSGYLTLGQHLFQRPEQFDTSWNFGPEAGTEWTVGEIADALASAFGVPGWEQGPKLDVREEARLRLHTQRARIRLDWRPTLPTSEALAWTADGYRRLHRGEDAGWLDEQIADYHRRLNALGTEAQPWLMDEVVTDVAA